MKDMNYLGSGKAYCQTIVQSILSSHKENKILLRSSQVIHTVSAFCLPLVLKDEMPELIAPKTIFVGFHLKRFKGMERLTFHSLEKWKQASRNTLALHWKVKEVVLWVTIGNYHHYIWSHLRKGKNSNIFKSLFCSGVPASNNYSFLSQGKAIKIKEVRQFQFSLQPY